MSSITPRPTVTYSTFDPQSWDVLRLDCVQNSIAANGKPIHAAKISISPATPSTTRHTRCASVTTTRGIDVQGSGGNATVQYVTFDDPHEPAGTLLKGEYPSGVIDWGADQWQIHVPGGAFGTFNLARGF